MFFTKEVICMLLGSTVQRGEHKRKGWELNPRRRSGLFWCIPLIQGGRSHNALHYWHSSNWWVNTFWWMNEILVGESRSNSSKRNLSNYRIWSHLFIFIETMYKAHMAKRHLTINQHLHTCAVETGITSYAIDNLVLSATHQPHTLPLWLGYARSGAWRLRIRPV